MPGPRTPDTTERRRAAGRKRAQRHRAKLVRELWAGAVKPCGGPSTCIWCDPEVPCDCRPGYPCSCERRLFERIEEEATERFGGVVGGLVVSALLDQARALHVGDDKDIRESRIKLVKVLLDEQHRARKLAIAERKLDLESARAPKPYVDVLKGLVDGDEQKETDDAACAS